MNCVCGGDVINLIISSAWINVLMMGGTYRVKRVNGHDSIPGCAIGGVKPDILCQAAREVVHTLCDLCSGAR